MYIVPTFYYVKRQLTSCDFCTFVAQKKEGDIILQMYTVKKGTELRTPEMFERYKNKKIVKGTEHECFICKMDVIRKFDFWNIIPNDYPYDAIATEHHMLCPKRHISMWQAFNEAEEAELKLIKETLEIEGFYDMLSENFSRARTYPLHYHLHLIQLKRET